MMINQLLAVSFGIPIGFAFLTLFAFLLFKNLRVGLANVLKEVTREWMTFMKRGIPIPEDYRRIEVPYPGEPTLTQARFQVEKNVAIGTAD